MVTDISAPGVGAWLDCISTGGAGADCSQAAVDADTCKAPGTSAKTCNELGWQPNAQGVCGESEVLAGACSLVHTFREAEAMCASNGARLCRASELIGGAVQPFLPY